MDGNNLPDFLAPGQYVKFTWVIGRVVDATRTANGKIMIQVDSAKAVWRNHDPEWLEYQPGLIEPATRAEFEQDAQKYLAHVTRNVETINRMITDGHR